MPRAKLQNAGIAYIWRLVTLAAIQHLDMFRPHDLLDERGNLSPSSRQSTRVQVMVRSRQPLHVRVSRRAVTGPRLDKTIRLVVLFAVVVLCPQLRAGHVAVDLPDGVKAVWDVI